MTVVEGRSPDGGSYPLKVAADGTLQIAASEAATGEKSTVNSTSTPLGAAGTFTGEFEQTDGRDLLISAYSDVAGTITVEFLNIGSETVRSQFNIAVVAARHKFRLLVKGPRQIRISYTNGADAQSTFELATYTGDFRHPSAPLNIPVDSDADSLVVRQKVEDEIMIGRVRGAMIINKFGRNSDVDAAEDIWRGGGDYTGFPTTTAEEFQVLSSSTDDDSAGTGARTLRLFYLNDDYEMFDENENFLYVDVTLDGTTGVNTGITGMRVWRVQVLTSGSNGSNVGTITVRWRTTTSVVFAQIPAGIGQTEIAIFTVPAGWTAYLKRYDARIFDNTSNRAAVAFKVRDFGSSTFRTTRAFSVATEAISQLNIYGGIKFTEKTDIVMRCISIQNSNADISASFDLRLEKNL